MKTFFGSSDRNYSTNAKVIKGFLQLETFILVVLFTRSVLGNEARLWHAAVWLIIKEKNLNGKLNKYQTFGKVKKNKV